GRLLRPSAPCPRPALPVLASARPPCSALFPYTTLFRSALVLDRLALDVHLGLERGHLVVPELFVDRGDDVGGEVDDLLEILRRQVQQVAQPTGHTLEVPDVGHRSGELDVAHPLTPDLGPGDLDTAALTDDALDA